ncbi:hypothetical protein Bbelb_438060 [Branchiostoma belcheri]|nr:hypothetical protein Bbelb_438060 [Branchiostoma belcheri]
MLAACIQPSPNVEPKLKSLLPQHESYVVEQFHPSSVNTGRSLGSWNVTPQLWGATARVGTVEHSYRQLDTGAPLYASPQNVRVRYDKKLSCCTLQRNSTLAVSLGGPIETIKMDSTETEEPFSGNVTNTTASPPGPPPKNPALVTAFNVVNTGILVFIMLAMGCTLELKTLIRLVRNPRQVMKEWRRRTSLARQSHGCERCKSVVCTLRLAVSGCVHCKLRKLVIDPRFFIGVVIGFLSQFLAMPLCGFAVAHIMQYSPMVAVGALVCTCCPGGTVSNLFTYWNKGDVPLSVTMTSCSTVLAMGMMPLNLWIYSRSWTDQAAVIPYTRIVSALASILGPALVGMLLKFWSDRIAKFVIKLGSVLGLSGIVASIILSTFINPDMFTRPWQLWLGAAILPYVGFSIGFCLASIPLFKMTQARRRTVAFETGLQNVSIAYAIIQLTFTAPGGSAFMGDLLIFSILYGPFMMIDGLLITAIYRLWVVLQKKRNAQGEEPKDETAEL